MRRRLITPLFGVALLVGCGGSTSKSTSSAGAGAAAQNPAGCKTIAAPAPKGAQQLPRPTLRLDPKRTHTATLETTCGTIVIALDVAHDPRTTASFASLAQMHFYDGLTFHRIVPGFVIQGGDPQGNGQGGPGYTVVERPPPTTKYLSGVVAMAKTGSDPPGASGSQFFIVTGGDAGLPAEYAVLGHVTSGMNVVARIGAVQADPQTGQPSSPIVITRLSVN